MISSTKARVLKALEDKRDAQLNRIYWLLSQANKRTLSSEETRELERLKQEYDIGGKGIHHE